MNIENIQQYRYSILPITKRDECHGTIILYMLSIERQQQYIIIMDFHQVKATTIDYATIYITSNGILKIVKFIKFQK